MKDKSMDLLSEEHLRKIKHKTVYKINETPKYRPLVNSNEEFDALPDTPYATKDGQPVPKSPTFTSEAGEQEDALKQGQTPTEPSNDQPIDLNAPKDSAPAIPAPETGITPPAPEDDVPVEPLATPETTAPEQEVNTIQNDIIKHNIEAMKSIHNELESLNNVVQGLNKKLDSLNADVEEVREPTNTEKLMRKKEVSHPFYYNLNDFWKDNWFNQKREVEHEKGIRELPDGSFIADFDDLPHSSKIDVQNSFNDMI